MLTRLALSTAAALLLQASVASAAEFHVTRSDDPPPGSGANCAPPSLDCSLRHAVEQAQGGSNTITVPPGNYGLTRGELLVTKTVFVNGAGPRRTTIEQLTPSSRVVEVDKPSAQDVSFALSGVTLTGGSVDDSTAPSASGGGIYIGGAGVTLTDVAIVGNRVFSGQGLEAAFGGGLFLSGVLQMRRTTVAGNRATGGTFAIGGIADFGSIYADDTTINGNAARVFELPPPSAMVAVGGVQIGLFSSGLLSTASVTLAGNRASGATGTNPLNAGNLLLEKSGSEFHAIDTIIAGGAGDSGRENCALDAGTVIFSRGYNLQDRGQQCGLTKTGDLINANPFLGPLANNGGATDTLALGKGSMAIDRGQPGACPDSGSSTLPVDQRGKKRVQGGRCDIGAFESTPPPPPHVTGLHLSPATFHRGKGTNVSYGDSRKATSTLTVLRRVRGIHQGAKCVPAPKKPKGGTKPKGCTILKLVGSFKHADVAGLNAFHWNGKLKSKALGKGRYRMRVVARDAQGRTSVPVTSDFKVVA